LEGCQCPSPRDNVLTASPWVTGAVWVGMRPQPTALKSLSSSRARPATSAGAMTS
jgi:hypothetical protein